MQFRLALASALVALAAAGCAHSPRHIVMAPVGPTPPTAIAADNSGTLVVYSPFETTAHFYDPPYKRRLTDYKILSAEGKLLRQVHNDSETVMEGPVWQALPPGRYQVVAQAERGDDVTVPVIIAAGRTTTVHLEHAGSDQKNPPTALAR